MFERILRFKQYLKNNRTSKNDVRLYLDIETLEYNSKEAITKQKESLRKNITYSVAVAYESDREENEQPGLDWVAFPSFVDFFETIFEASEYGGRPTRRNKIYLIAHNGNKYDFLFLMREVLVNYPSCQVMNLSLPQAVSNDDAVKDKEITRQQKQEGVFLERRVKSKSNTSFELWLKGLCFRTEDTVLKTNLSLRTLGVKLNKKGLIASDFLKTDFDYSRFNIGDDMGDAEAFNYARQCFDRLTQNEFIYIRNDVLILGMVVLCYDVIFPGFDFNKTTFTQNIAEDYKGDRLANYQLFNQVGDKLDPKEDKFKINLTDYEFSGENFYNYAKSFYRGGLNFYNDRLIGKLLTGKMFSIDINSSYPASMWIHEVPSFIRSFSDFKKRTRVAIHHEDHTWGMYRMEREDFNNEVLNWIDSEQIQKMIAKYYNVNDFVNINTNTLKMLEMFTPEGHEFKELTLLSSIIWETVPFGGRDIIADNYFTKSQGKSKVKLIMHAPNNFEVTDEPNTDVYTPEEINNSKVKLNGVYGIPALRAYFNLARIAPDGSYYIIQNGYKNNERNIVFSAWVTSVSIRNLLTPLGYLTAEEIDENFIYCDTDSLYMKGAVYDKMPKSLFHKLNIGKWDIEHDLDIEKMYVLNHKKYCYETSDGEIVTRSGGINEDAFNKNMSFEQFVKTQFSEGCSVITTKSCINQLGTVAIYESNTELQQGKKYQTRMTASQQKQRQEALAEIRELYNESPELLEDAMYFEADFGTLSAGEAFEKQEPVVNRMPLKKLKYYQSRARSFIGV